MHSFIYGHRVLILECFTVCKTGSRHVINQFCPGCSVAWSVSCFARRFPLFSSLLGANRADGPTSTGNRTERHI